MKFIADCGIKHFLIDMPSVDKEKDNGKGNEKENHKENEFFFLFSVNENHFHIK